MKNFRMIVCCVIVFFAVSIPRGYELLWAQDLWGDINSDGSVNDADTQKLTACILGNGACKYCDLNTDGQYNIVDVQLLTNAIDVDKFCNNPTDIPKTECVALGSLYYSTNGADWTNQSNWMSSYTVCSWYGVTCMTDSVSGLNLSNNDLRGSIPDQLENLTNVQTLNLNTNQLIGTIPSQLGTLNKLQTLDLSNNQLTGNIPSELGNLQLNLHTLDLSHNQLTGTVPLSLGNLTVNLYTLNLSDNQLNEGIPQQLGNLSNLQMLDLSNNQLTGNIPTELSTLSMLQTLNLSGNQLSGTISPQLANLSNLRYLYLNANQLTGSIPPELGNLGRLSILNLANTQLGNSLPANLTNLGALTPAHTLSSFAFNSTNLCEPTDSTFQTWLGGIATLQRTNVACQANDYYAYKQYGGAVHDVDATESGDTNMCWAFSAANVLDWTDWGVSPNLDDDTEIFSDYQTKWENKGSMMGYAWRWWFDGTPPPGAEQEFDTAIWSQLIQKPSGSYVEDPFFDYYFFSCNDVMAAIKDFLHSGYGVSLLLYSNSASMNTVGHALTVWGYQAYADGTITKLWVTDSLKNTLNNLRELPVAYRANWIDNQLYGLKWRVTHDVAAAPYQGWLLPGAQALKSKQINFARVHKAGTGVGTVTSSDGKIACGADCLEAYSSPPTITLTATAGSGVTFTGWQGACSGSAPTCTLTVQGEKQVIAIFTLNTSPNYTITVNADTGVSVWPPSPVGVSKGDNATFVFLPTPPYQITEVLVDGVSQGPATSYTFSTVAANHQLTIHTLHKGSAYNVVLSKKCVNTDHEVINCPPGDNAIVKIGDKVCDAECMRIIGCAFGAVNLEVIPLGVNDFVCWEEADGACYSTSKTITVSGTFGARPVIECAGSD